MYDDINGWKLISSKFSFTVISMFIFNVVISTKENIYNIFRFQWSSNDAVGFRLLHWKNDARPKLFFVEIFVRFVRYFHI